MCVCLDALLSVLIVAPNGPSLIQFFQAKALIQASMEAAAKVKTVSKTEHGRNQVDVEIYQGYDGVDTLPGVGQSQGGCGSVAYW